MLDLNGTVDAPLEEPRPLVGRSIAACLCLAGHLGLALFMGVVLWQRLGLLRLLEQRILVEHSSLVASDLLVRTLSRASLALSLMTAIAFLAWLYRANQNLAAFGSEPRNFSPGRAVGSFFMPFLNLFLPYQAVQEVWQASDRTSRKSRLVLVWWVLLLARGIPGWLILVSTQAAGGERLQKLIGLTQSQLVGTALTLPAAVAAIAVVFRIDQRQSALIEARAQGRAPGALRSNTIT